MEVQGTSSGDTVVTVAVFSPHLVPPVGFHQHGGKKRELQKLLLMKLTPNPRCCYLLDLFYFSL